MSSFRSQRIIRIKIATQPACCVLDGLRVRLQVAFVCTLACEVAEVHSGHAVDADLSPERVLVAADWGVALCAHSIRAVGHSLLCREGRARGLAQFKRLKRACQEPAAHSAGESGLWLRCC